MAKIYFVLLPMVCYPGQPNIGARHLTGRRRVAAPPEAEDEEAPAEEQAVTPHEASSWTISGGTITRTHRTPRTTLNQPDEGECPIPIKYLDSHRRAEADLGAMAQRHIRDLWCENGPSPLSDE